MKFCIVWKEDKSRQNDSIKSLWNFPTQMTLSEKYDFEEYSPSFWILKQNHWSEMRYAVDNFDFGFLCWDVKNSLFAHLPWYTFASILPRLTPQTKILPNLWGFFISSGYYSFPRRNWKQCLCKIFGANKMHCTWEDVELAITQLRPRVFSFSNMAVTGRTKNPYHYVAR